jgi:hypothetical protein
LVSNHPETEQITQSKTATTALFTVTLPCPCVFIHPFRLCNDQHVLVLQFRQACVVRQREASNEEPECWLYDKLSVVDGVQEQDGTWRGGMIMQQEISFATQQEAGAACAAEPESFV